jgi:hypothetical protein
VTEIIDHTMCESDLEREPLPGRSRNHREGADQLRAEIGGSRLIAVKCTMASGPKSQDSVATSMPCHCLRTIAKLDRILLHLIVCDDNGVYRGRKVESRRC